MAVSCGVRDAHTVSDSLPMHALSAHGHLGICQQYTLQTFTIAQCMCMVSAGRIDPKGNP